MKGAKGRTIVLLALLAAAPLGAPGAAQAQAQPPADPIGALLRNGAPPKDVDPEEPDTAASGGKVDADPVVPATRRPAPRAPTLSRPVRIEETGKAPDGPPTPADVAYDSRLRASMASAQGFQGPMDGGWTLFAGNRELYVLQLTDRNGAVEGAWRDLRRPGALDASGFIDGTERTGGDLTIRFAGGAVAVLHSADGRWAGELTEAGARHPVTLRRRNP
jgi:hypothetical protein